MSRQYTVACLAGEGVGAELMAEAMGLDVSSL